jgi:hypothetical protein
MPPATLPSCGEVFLETVDGLRIHGWFLPVGDANVGTLAVGPATGIG